MARKLVIDAVEARLEAQLTACPILGVNLTGDTPEDGSTFAQVQYPLANTRQMDLAGTRYREEGTIRLLVFAQRGAELGPALAIADDLAALFRGRKFAGVQTYAPSSPVIDDRNDDGMYFALSISVPYDFDFTDEAGLYA